MEIFEMYSLLSFIYLIPAYLLYLTFAYFLFTNDTNEIKTPFFSIIRILACVDLCEMIFSTLCIKGGYLLSLLSMFQPMGEKNGYATFLIYGFSLLGCSQSIFHVILAFNRITAILFPHGYKKIWNGKPYFFIILFAFAFPAFFYSWLLYFGGTVAYNPIYQNIVVDPIRPDIPWLRIAILNTIIVVSTCILTLVFDVITFILLIKNNLHKSDKKLEFRLLTVSFVFLISHCIFLASTLTFLTIISETNGHILLIFLKTSMDIQSLISPFCILLLNGNVRKEFFKRKINSRSAVARMN